MSNDISKLPKWALTLITDLTRERDDAAAALQAHLDTQTPTPIFVEEHITIGGQSMLFKRYIQDTREITFDLTEKGKRRSEITVRINHANPHELHIHSSWDGLIILPQVSNVVTVRTNGR